MLSYLKKYFSNFITSNDNGFLCALLNSDPGIQSFINYCDFAGEASAYPALNSLNYNFDQDKVFIPKAWLTFLIKTILFRFIDIELSF